MVIKKLKDFGFDTDRRTYVIAEIGINHGGNLDSAKRLIDSAVNSGVDAVKFQTYITEKRAPKGNQQIFDILKKCELPFDSFGKLKAHADQYNVDFFSTPFDRESVECLEDLDVSLYKIASFDVVNHDLLRTVSHCGKPVIMSVGMSNLKEIDAAYNVLKEGTKSIAILHCVSAYPTPEDQAHLASIYDLQARYDCIIGQSDHTTGIDVPLFAAAAGAQILEKHFKIDEQMDCVDAPVSITEKQMTQLVSNVRRLEKIFGEPEFGVRTAEAGMDVFRRSTK